MRNSYFDHVPMNRGFLKCVAISLIIICQGLTQNSTHLIAAWQQHIYNTEYNGTIARTFWTCILSSLWLNTLYTVTMVPVEPAPKLSS